MGKGKTITFEKMDNILFLCERGLNKAETASVTDVSPKTVSKVMIAYNAAKDGDTGKLNECGFRMQEWACSKFNIKPVAEITPTPKNDNTAQAVVALLNCINDLTKAIESIDKRLSAMQLSQQGIRGELGEHTKKLVETINVNGDIATKENERMIDLLGGIKMNTRKRGNNDAT